MLIVWTYEALSPQCTMAQAMKLRKSRFACLNDLDDRMIMMMRIHLRGSHGLSASRPQKMDHLIKVGPQRGPRFLAIIYLYLTNMNNTPHYHLK